MEQAFPKKVQDMKHRESSNMGNLGTSIQHYTYEELSKDHNSYLKTKIKK